MRLKKIPDKWNMGGIIKALNHLIYEHNKKYRKKRFVECPYCKEMVEVKDE